MNLIQQLTHELEETTKWGQELERENKHHAASLREAADLLEKYHGTMKSMYGKPPILPMIEAWQERYATMIHKPVEPIEERGK